MAKSPFCAALDGTIRRACENIECSREDLAKRIGFNRNSLYNATRHPRAIGIEKVTEIAELARLSAAETLALQTEWLRERAEDVSMIRALVAALDYSARITSGTASQRRERVFRKVFDELGSAGAA